MPPLLGPVTCVCAGEDNSGLWALLDSVLFVVSRNVQRLITEEENVCSAVWQHLCDSPVE